MGLTSSSTIDEIIAQYADNALWEGDIAAARLCLQALRLLRIKRPVMTRAQVMSVQWDSIDSEIGALSGFVAARASGRQSFFRTRALMD